jgi:hypothetical protein
MSERISSIEVSAEKIRRWVELAREKSEKCFICARIASESDPGEGALGSIKISGIEISADVQISHLRRCVGGREGDA